MGFTTLIDTAALAAHASDPVFAVIDCRYDLKDEARGAREYAQGHIPGAVYASLDRDLSGTRTGRNGRHPLPDSAALTTTFGRLGVADGVQVVAYDQDGNIYASRLWWMLRWLGHDATSRCSTAALRNGSPRTARGDRALKRGRLVTSTACRRPAG